ALEPDVLARLDEGASDIMRADDAELERDTARLGIADRCRHAAVRDGDHVIHLDRSLARQLRSDVLTDLVNRHSFGDRIRTREIDVLEDARTRLHLFER